MARVHIVKNGIKNVVDEELFKSKYKKAGWKLDNDFKEQNDNIMVKLKNETEMNNYVQMKKRSTKIFNDNLIKSGEK
jgi:CRISPR/Cas system CMR subunit Cmr6 (Cas7 group RAMP superfamily)